MSTRMEYYRRYSNQARKKDHSFLFWFVGCVAAVSLALVLLSSCGSVVTRQPGNLEVGILEEFQPRLITPPEDEWTFTEYIVEIEHQVTHDTQSQTAVPPDLQVTFSNIPSGDYDITITGNNTYAENIGYGSGVVNVIANDTTTTEVQVNWKTGDGTLDLDWTVTPPDLVYSPAITGQLMDIDGTWSDITIVDNGDGTYSYDTTLPTGFYAHRFELHSMGNTNVHISGGMEAIFIQAGKTTAGAYTFDSNNVLPPETGSTIIIIWEPQDMPFNTYFTDSMTEVDYGESYTLEAAADVTVDSWQWFKNGIAMAGETNSTLNVTAPTQEAIDTYSILAQKGGALSSAQKAVSTVPIYPTGLLGMYNYYYNNSYYSGGAEFVDGGSGLAGTFTVYFPEGLDSGDERFFGDWWVENTTSTTKGTIDMEVTSIESPADSTPITDQQSVDFQDFMTANFGQTDPVIQDVGWVKYPDDRLELTFPTPRGLYTTYVPQN